MSDHLDETKEVCVRGVWFEIRKLQVLDHLHGSSILTESYRVWAKPSDQKLVEAATEKIKKHYRDVFLACVIDPKLVRKEADAGTDSTWVDRLFLDFELAQDLYLEIMIFTHGKKKIQQSMRRFN